MKILAILILLIMSSGCKTTNVYLNNPEGGDVKIEIRITGSDVSAETRLK